MSDQTNLPVPFDGPPQSPERRTRGLLFTLIIVLAAGLTGAFVSQAMSEEAGWGPGFWRGGWHHGGWMDGPRVAAGEGGVDTPADAARAEALLAAGFDPDRATDETSAGAHPGHPSRTIFA